MKNAEILNPKLTTIDEYIDVCVENMPKIFGITPYAYNYNRKLRRLIESFSNYLSKQGYIWKDSCRDIEYPDSFSSKKEIEKEFYHFLKIYNESKTENQRG